MSNSQNRIVEFGASSTYMDESIDPPKHSKKLYTASSSYVVGEVIVANNNPHVVSISLMINVMYSNELSKYIMDDKLFVLFRHILQPFTTSRVLKTAVILKPNTSIMMSSSDYNVESTYQYYEES